MRSFKTVGASTGRVQLHILTKQPNTTASKGRLGFHTSYEQAMTHRKGKGKPCYHDTLRHALIKHCSSCFIVFSQLLHSNILDSTVAALAATGKVGAFE